MTRVDTIFCADLHLRMTTPACRTDDFFVAECRKLSWLRSLWEKYDRPRVLCAGDVFDSALMPSEHAFKLVLMAAELLPRMHVIAGQHDLPYHRLECFSWSPLGMLTQIRKDMILPDQFPEEMQGVSFGVEAKIRRETRILLLHQLVWDKEKPFPGAPEGGNARGLMSRYHSVRTFITGDNHLPFIVRKGEQLLVNCGSMMRTDVTQADFKPRVWLWNETKNDVEEAFYPIEEGVVDTRSHRQLLEKEERMSDFRNTLEAPTGGLTLDFRRNVETMAESITDDRVKEIVTECIEEGAK